jgi:autophagy-related protein 13
MMPSPANNSPTIMTPTAAAHHQNSVTGSSTPLYPLGGGHHQLTNIKFLSKQERESLLQYTKHFVRKAVQIVVQSRLGEKKPTKSRVYAYNTDWFNLSIKDLAQITAMTKSSLGAAETLFGGSGQSAPLCVEISLRTPENQTMILETWCILFNEQLVDPTQKVCYNVYKKMSVVLRSLACLTRSIPTYQLSRRQNSDTYVLLYRMYTGEPVVHHLGENYATAKVGTVGTPVGSLIVNVAYRTRLTMTPQNSHATNEYTPGILIKVVYLLFFKLYD